MPQFGRDELPTDLELPELIIRLNEFFRRINVAPPTKPKTGWSTSNVSTTRSLDASTATLTDVANVLGSLVEDMKEQRLLKD